MIVPPASDLARRLQKCARQAFNQALRAARAGERVSEVGAAVETEVRRWGYAVVRELAGHGVGRQIHEEPSVPNFRDRAASRVMTEGLVLAVEPMLTASPARVVEEPDGWTLRTHDRGLAVHHENTIVVRRGAAPIVLTA